jgi:Spy/CpxP family protein refolding chaperone
MMNLVRSSRMATVLFLVGALPVLGCGAGTSAEEALDSGEAEIEQAGDRLGRHPHRGPGAMLVHTALEELDLTDEQRGRLDSLFRRAEPSEAERAERTSKALALAEAVRAGSLDVAAFEKGGRPDRRAAFAADLDELHDLLSAEQRRELVAALEDRAPHRGGSEGDGRPGPGGPVGFLLRGIELSESQQRSIENALTEAGFGPRAGKTGKDGKRHPDHAEMKAKMEAVMDAFLKEDFDAAAVLPEPPRGEVSPRDWIEGLAIALPFLTAQQREELAARIERGPVAHGPRGRRGPPDGE